MSRFGFALMGVFVIAAAVAAGLSADNDPDKKTRVEVLLACENIVDPFDSPDQISAQEYTHYKKCLRRHSGGDVKPPPLPRLRREVTVTYEQLIHLAGQQQLEVCSLSTGQPSAINKSDPQKLAREYKRLRGRLESKIGIISSASFYLVDSFFRPPPIKQALACP